MVCSICKGAEKVPGKPNHNAKSCPRLKLDIGDAAIKLSKGAAVGTVVVGLTAVCPPAGMLAGGVLIGKKVVDGMMLAIQNSNAKTDAEKAKVGKEAGLWLIGGFLGNAE